MKSSLDISWDALKDFLNSGYFEDRNGENVVRADLMADYAEAFGQLFARHAKVSSSQLRAFYGDVKALERKIGKNSPAAFDKNYHLIKMLKAKAAYIQGKKSGGNVPMEFRDYIGVCVDCVDSPETFQAFLKFFESTVGFFFGFGGEYNR